MLHSVFSSNRPVVFTLLIPFAVVLAVLAGLYSAPPSHMMGGMLFKQLSYLMGGSKIFLLIAGTFVNLVSAFLINKLSNDHEFTERENYFPSLVYFLFISLNLSWYYLNPVILGNLFILLALRRLLRIYRVQNVTAKLYDAGLLLTLGVLVFPPLVVTILLIWMSLGQLRTFNLREWVVPLFGIATPLIYGAVYYWWFDASPDYYRFTKFTGFSIGELKDANHLVDYAFMILGFLFSLIGLSGFFKEMTISTVHKKNTKAVFLWLCLLIAAAYLLASGLRIDQAATTVLWAIPCAIFLPVFFMVTKRKKAVSTAYYIWLILGVLTLVLNSISF